MSSSQLVDGKTGEPIGYNVYGGQYVTTTTSSYVPAAPVTSTYAYGTGSGYGGERVERVERDRYAVRGGVAESSYETRGYAVGQSNAQVVGTTVNTGKEVIKGESRIEYVPFEKKIIEYKDQAKVERVPKKVKKIEYREERKVENIPKEVTVTDYYAVEYLRQYIPQYVPEKRVEYVQVPKKTVRYEYIPVERYSSPHSDKSFTTPTRPSKDLNKPELKEDSKSTTPADNIRQDIPNSQEDMPLKEPEKSATLLDPLSK